MFVEENMQNLTTFQQSDKLPWQCYSWLTSLWESGVVSAAGAAGVPQLGVGVG